MRKLLIATLLASAVATPALAAQADRDTARAERQQDREERQQSREERREERQDARTERVQERRGPVSSEESRQVEQARATRAARLSSNDGPRVDQAERQQLRQQRIETRQETRDQRIEDRQQLREQRTEANRARRDIRQAERPVPVLRPRVPVVSNTPRAGTQPPARTEVRHRAPVNWSQHWRNDHRYDWYNWRNRHRSLFRLGYYYDPFGWGYQRYNIGWRMWPSYYGSNFWLNDPWQYRLPYAPPGYRWIRYFDDAILIDTWDGRVVDVIYNFFW